MHLFASFCLIWRHLASRRILMSFCTPLGCRVPNFANFCNLIEFQSLLNFRFPRPSSRCQMLFCRCFRCRCGRARTLRSPIGAGLCENCILALFFLARLFYTAFRRWLAPAWRAKFFASVVFWLARNFRFPPRAGSSRAGCSDVPASLHSWHA